MLLTGEQGYRVYALGSCLYDISNNRILDAVFSEKLDEHSCAIGHMELYEHLHPTVEKACSSSRQGVSIHRPHQGIRGKGDDLPYAALQDKEKKFLDIHILIINDTEHKSGDFRRIYF
ncbi:hypothetical protein SDC9_94023 [bioreactor metagenome]|uniref:Uncharacterized protein n=1 Tax=bioreactor metagenome TaxID=1076179 RepID=A0A645AC98_9ZZZZ